MTVPMIEIRGALRRFGATVAVDRVDLAVEPGEFLTLLGPSGCGKTTLLRLVSGFERSDAGQVFIGGNDMTLVPPHRRPVHQVFQSYALFPHLTVGGNVAFGLRMQGIAKTEIGVRVRDTLELVALEGFEERKPSELSGGQRQRVALARAIVGRPKVLLLDEPLSALDARLRQEMQLELKQLQRRLGMTFLFVTHDQEEALAMSDRIAVMNCGRIEQLAPAAEIYRRPCSPFVARFVGEANLFQAELVGSGLLRLADGSELRCETPTAPFGIGSPRRLTVCVRPEDVRLERGGSAIVEEIIFKGSVAMIRFRTASGLSWLAQANGGAAPGFRPGDPMTGSVDPASVITLES